MVKLDKIIAVSGLQGLYRMVGNRKDGLILEDPDNGRRFFAASRQYQFTPLEGISIYTTNHERDYNVPLKEVFGQMKARLGDLTLPDHKAADSATLRAYLVEILPDYDEDKVQVSDMRKLIKWFEYLRQRNLLVDAPPAEESTVEEVKA
jgi:hypothetical protein